MMFLNNLNKIRGYEKTFYNILIMCSFGNFLLAKRPTGAQS